MKITMNNGQTFPQIGLGTWNIPPAKINQTLTHAMQLNYKHIDAAHVYENEKEIGDFLKQNNIKREEIFITSKLWNSYHDHPKIGLEKSLNDLQVDYLDLYLIHWPVNFKNKDGITVKEDNKFVLQDFNVKQVWTEMESFVENNLVRSIGVSNFGVENLKEILSFCKIRPQVLQIEMHPYLQQKELVDFCYKNDIRIVSYSSLGSSDPELLNDKVINGIAKKHNKTPSQVILNWLIKQNVGIIPKSMSYEHMKENLEVFDLDEDDLEKIKALDRNKKYCDPVHFGPDRYK